MTTKTKTRRHKAFPVASFKALDGAEGTFEALVSVFDNVDLAGDRVVKGAFTKSLDAWSESGDPIPVIFSHRWDDLDAHIGVVLEAEERDAGLWVKAQLDMDQPAAARVFELLDRRSLREFSFAYDVIEEKEAGRVNDLTELDLFEVGPTLKGMNPDTQLIDTRAAQRLDGLKAAAGAVKADKVLDALDSKAFVQLDGSYERRMADIRDAVAQWASGMAGEAGEELYGVWLEATFDDRTIAEVEMWSEPPGGGTFYEAGYTIGSDGAVELAEPKAVRIEGQVVPKSVHRRGSHRTHETKQPDREAKSNAKPERREVKGEEQPTRSAADVRLLAELEAAAL